MALAAPSRRRLLDALRGAQGPMDVAALAAAVGLHVTTVRGHLAMLERAGLVCRTRETSGVPGRPQQLYALVDETRQQEVHRQLAEFLASVLATDAEGSDRAEEAGRRWAQAQLPNPEPISWENGTRRIVDLFDAMGFAPRPIPTSRCRGRVAPPDAPAGGHPRSSRWCLSPSVLLGRLCRGKHRPTGVAAGVVHTVSRLLLLRRLPPPHGVDRTGPASRPAHPRPRRQRRPRTVRDEDRAARKAPTQLAGRWPRKPPARPPVAKIMSSASVTGALRT